MLDSRNAFVTASFLQSVWSDDYAAWRDTPAEAELLERLRRWAARQDLKETSAEIPFVSQFFNDTWGYVATGEVQPGDPWTLWPKYAVRGAGAGGGTGEADLALGWFKAGETIAQVLCEYKDMRSSLDADQRRKGNTRSPVRQALDYLAQARRPFLGSEPQVPTWAIVTDMNEFRLYWYDRGQQQHVGFVIAPRDLFQGPGLLGDDEPSRFARFLFAKLFHRKTLVSTAGPSLLRRLIEERRFRDRAIEDTFYGEYRALRERLYTELLARNGPGTPRFPGTRGRLVRLAQKILDRLLFVFFCDDMGQRLAYPAKLLQSLLVARANDPFYDPNGTTLWQELVGLFRAMNEGGSFGGRPMHRFNGGLFEPDPILEALQLPNSVFCQPLQGANEASIAGSPETVLYLCATYNYAADLGEGGMRGDERSLGLYTLGRIFEQSITELEIREAEADERPSINKASKRKTDGVYYTPEWAVERLVEGTIEPCLAERRVAAGWREGETPTIAALDAYIAGLRAFAVCDIACGSGAFLITALRYLAAEWRRVGVLRVDLTGGKAVAEDEAAVVARLLRENIFGVDINPASVEIAQLALWLHTARGDTALSSLDANICCGNSLVGPDFRLGQQSLPSAEEAERVNVFDWREAFPAVAARGGFDAIVSNPPYVKLQNFRPAHTDVARYLVEGRPGVVPPPFRSTRTGNFDLYLPFIEQGIAMLGPSGRLGYIAPSLWAVNEYGAGLRELVAEGQFLDRWLDFRSFQVFDEATTYTALQFFGKAPTPAVRVALAPDGKLAADPWADETARLTWPAQEYGDRWLLVTGPERALVQRLAEAFPRLEDPRFTRAIFQGLITSADAIYHLKRLAPGRYLCEATERGKPAPFEVEIEDAIMRPLVSGREAKRYIAPLTDTWVLFPYRAVAGKTRRMEVIPAATMRRDFPKAWAYLERFRAELEGREAKRDEATKKLVGPMVGAADWYRYGRNQNLDKQHLAKVVVAQTVPSLRVCMDTAGEFALNNVRVNGILPASGIDAWFLTGVLNAPVADWVFRRIAKPKAGGWFEANRQFIAPLPIPEVTAAAQAVIAERAEQLQTLHTTRGDLIADIERRLAVVQRRSRPETWLFPTLAGARSVRGGRRASPPPASSESPDLALAARHALLDAKLHPTVELDAELHNGELRLLADGAVVIDGIFVTASEGPFVLAQWKVVAATFKPKPPPPPARGKGKRKPLLPKPNANGVALAKVLRRVAAPDNPAVVEQVLEAVAKLEASEASIDATENAINGLIEAGYGLSAEERRLIKAG